MVDLGDSSGDNTEAFVSCHDCYVERAALIGNVRELMLMNKEKSAAENSPRELSK